MEKIKEFILKDNFLQVYTSLKNHEYFLKDENFFKEILNFIETEEKNYYLNRIYKKYFLQLQIENNLIFQKNKMSDEKNENNPCAIFKDNYITLRWRDSELSLPAEKVKACVVAQKHDYYDVIKGPMIILGDGKDSRVHMYVAEVEKDCVKFAKFLNDLIVLCNNRKIQFHLEERINFSQLE